MRQFCQLLAALAPMLVAQVGSAAPGDAAATRETRRAIDEHYLMTEFPKAKAVLEKAIAACQGGRCSGRVEAKAWLYLGVVEGAGNQDLQAAKKAFERALSLDPTIQFDPDLATRETEKAFQEAKALAEASESPGPEVSPEVVGDLECSPGPRAVQTNTRVPIHCRAGADAASMELRYKPFGAPDFEDLPMARTGDGFRGEIPCDATELVGSLAFYVRAKDADGEVVDNFGAAKAPIALSVQNEPVDEPPTFPGEAPPARCEGEVLCPPDFPGCESEAAPGRGDRDWGAGCDDSLECKAGLLCLDGRCEQAPSCQVDEDCSVGACEAGTCSVSSEGPVEDTLDNWVGLQVAQDLLWVEGRNACSVQTQLGNDLHCFEFNPATGERDLQYPGYRANGDIGDPFPGKSIGGGFVPATTRVMFSYDRRLVAGLFAGVRLGYAFRGGPTTRDGAEFLPVHAEARFSYWFGQGSFRPYVVLGGGLAQVDARTELTGVRDCTTVAPDPTLGNAEQPFLDCIAGDPRYASTLQPFTVDVWKKVGQGFATGGAGLVFLFTEQLGARFDLGALLLLPSSGFALQPSLGLLLGL